MRHFYCPKNKTLVISHYCTPGHHLSPSSLFIAISVSRFPIASLSELLSSVILSEGIRLSSDLQAISSASPLFHLKRQHSQRRLLTDRKSLKSLPLHAHIHTRTHTLSCTFFLFLAHSHLISAGKYSNYIKSAMLKHIFQ